MMDVTYARISGSLGSLLRLWAAIERSARDEIIRANGSLPKSAHGIVATLRTWVETVHEVTTAASLSRSLAPILFDRLREPLNVRNGLCHGLVGISRVRGNAPAQLTWETDGKEHHISWEELQATFRWLSKVPAAISMISAPPSGGPADRIIDNPENREWWFVEFGLKL